MGKSATLSISERRVYVTLSLCHRSMHYAVEMMPAYSYLSGPERLGSVSLLAYVMYFGSLSLMEII